MSWNDKDKVIDMATKIEQDKEDAKEYKKERKDLKKHDIFDAEKQPVEEEI